MTKKKITKERETVLQGITTRVSNFFRTLTSKIKRTVRK